MLVDVFRTIVGMKADPASLIAVDPQCFYVSVIHDGIHPSSMNRDQAMSVSFRVGRGLDLTQGSVPHKIRAFHLSPSSRGLGHRVFIPATGVRLP